MSPALVMISETSALISRSKYLTECIKYVVDQGYFPISKDTYVNYVKMDEYEFLELMLQTCSKVFLFIDFGINNLMKEAIERAVKRDMPIVYINIPDIESYLVTPNLVGILENVATKTGIPSGLMKSKSRKREIVRARQFFCKRAKELTIDSLAKIGSTLNDDFDHTAVIYSIKQVNNVRGLSELYDYYFNGGDMPRTPEKMLPKKKPVEAIKKPSEPLKPKMEATVYRKEDNRPCIGFQAYSGYRVHSV